MLERMARCRNLGAIALIVLGGCDRAFGLVRVSDAAPVPDAPDAAVDAPPQRCFGSGPPSGIRVCLVMPAKLFYDIDASTTTLLDTGQPGMCDQLQPQVGLPDLCVVVAETIHIDGKLRVTGAVPQSRALVLLATTELSITGTLDVSSNDTIFGPGNGGCGGGPSGNNGGGGAAGGSFGGLGGHGGGSGGGSPIPTATGVIVRGGCAGGTGDNAGGAGGRGGGALYLIAGTTLAISGTVDASGAGGRGSPASLAPAGGGGGGSGGLIVVDAPSATVTGTLFANGGGGGQGSGTTSAGSPGIDPLTWNVPALGGSMGSAGGAGGDGAATTTTTGRDGAAGITGKGSGGGGGGIGIIKVIAPGSIGGSESPAPS